MWLVGSTIWRGIFLLWHRLLLKAELLGIVTVEVAILEGVQKAAWRGTERFGLGKDSGSPLLHVAKSVLQKHWRRNPC